MIYPRKCPHGSTLRSSFCCWLFPWPHNDTELNRRQSTCPYSRHVGHVNRETLKSPSRALYVHVTPTSPTSGLFVIRPALRFGRTQVPLRGERILSMIQLSRRPPQSTSRGSMDTCPARAESRYLSSSNGNGSVRRHEAGTRVCFTDVNFISVISEATQDIGPMDYRGGLLEEKICLLGLCLPVLLSAHAGDRPRNPPRLGP